ncbi:MAG: mechanosensitive ion channel domain-containing protein [Myxococcota bacterium]
MSIPPVCVCHRLRAELPRIAAVVLAALLAAAQAAAQNDSEAGAAAAAAASKASFGTPRADMESFLVAARKGDFSRAAAFLDLRRVPESERESRGPDLARRLKIVLDRSLWVDLDALSEDTEGFPNDGLRARRDLVGTISSQAGDVAIHLDRVLDVDGTSRWRISGGTLAQVPRLYEEFGYGPVEELLPRVFLDVHVMELALWQWIGAAGGLVLAFMAGWVAALGLLALCRPLVRRSRSEIDNRLLDATVQPLRLALTLGFFHLVTLPLGLSVPAGRFVGGTLEVGLAVATTWLLFRIVDVLGDQISRRLLRSGVPGAHFIPLGQRSLKVAIGLFSGLYVISAVFQRDVTTLVAGLGIGGLAVALAAQKTIENFFGGVFLAVDRPVRPGDFCRFGERVGTVEDIGFRSTRIRTLGRTLVTIPNSEFSSLHLENFAPRDRILFHSVLGLRYETTPDQVRHALAAIRRMLLSHPKVEPDPARVRFVGLGSYSLDLEVFAYVGTSDWNEFLAVREDLLLRLMDIVAGSGSGFAFPSQTNYVARDDGLDAEQARLAEEEIRALREKSEGSPD